MIIDISIHVFIFSQVLPRKAAGLVRKVYLHMSRGNTSLAGVKDGSCCRVRFFEPEIQSSISLILCSFVLYPLHKLSLQPGQNRSNLPALDAEF